MSVRLMQLYRTFYLEGPTFSLLLCFHHLEILNNF